MNALLIVLAVIFGGMLGAFIVCVVIGGSR